MHSDKSFTSRRLWSAIHSAWGTVRHIGRALAHLACQGWKIVIYLSCLEIISDSRNRLRVKVDCISPVKPVSREGSWRNKKCGVQREDKTWLRSSLPLFSFSEKIMQARCNFHFTTFSHFFFIYTEEKARIKKKLSITKTPTNLSGSCLLMEEEVAVRCEMKQWLFLKSKGKIQYLIIGMSIPCIPFKLLPQSC